jgi:AcrR family transcriptional regulator
MSRAAPKPSHDRILAAAERVFTEKGFGPSSLRDLLTAAECSTTAFYARFPSKDAVLEALIRQLLGDLHDTAADALARAKDPSAGWDLGVDLLVAALADRKGLMKVALTEGAMIPASRDALRDTYALLAALLSGRLQRLADRRRLEVVDADALAWAIVGALTMQVTRWAVFETLDDEGLGKALRATARALFPAPRRRRS